MKIRQSFPVRQVWRWVDAYAAAIYGGEPGPIGNLSCKLTHVLSLPQRPLDSPFELEMSKTLSGRFVLTGFVSADGRRVRLPEGQYRARIESDFYETVDPEIEISVEAKKVEIPTLWLLPADDRYPFRDSLLASPTALGFRGKVGEAKASVEAQGVDAARSVLRETRSGADGRWYLSVEPKDGEQVKLKFFRAGGQSTEKVVTGKAGKFTEVNTES